jgi:hypothetical protein
MVQLKQLTYRDDVMDLVCKKKKKVLEPGFAPGFPPLSSGMEGRRVELLLHSSFCQLHHALRRCGAAVDGSGSDGQVVATATERESQPGPLGSDKHQQCFPNGRGKT